MDAATAQIRIYKGRGKAALRLGLTCNVCRPVDATQALANIITTTPVAFNAADNKYLRPSLYGKPVWFADYDGTLTQAGDYLQRQSDSAVWFIAAQQQLLPIVVVECNRSIKVERQAASTTVGAQPYGGLTAIAPVLGSTAGWPCSILIGGRALSSDGLPADVKDSGFRVLLPPSVPITILEGDILLDDLGARYAVESAEQSDLGWRLTVNAAHA